MEKKQENYEKNIENKNNDNNTVIKIEEDNKQQNIDIKDKNEEITNIEENNIKAQKSEEKEEISINNTINNENNTNQNKESLNSINKEENDIMEKNIIEKYDNHSPKKAENTSMKAFFQKFDNDNSNKDSKIDNKIKEEEINKEGIKEIIEKKNEPKENKETNEILEENINENKFINITEDEGIKKKILKKGEGANPKEGNTVLINYIGKYGEQIFAESNENEPFSFTLGENKVIKGWEIAVKTMKLGEKSEFIMTSNYTYGDKQINEEIPPKSTLTYIIELKGINYKNTEDSLENLTYEEKLQWGKLLKKNGVDKFKENDIQGARECFIKALSFLRYMNPQKEEEKEGTDLFLTILANICNCYNKEKDYDSVLKFAIIGINIKSTPKLLYFRTIALAYLEEFDNAEKDLNELINLFNANGEQNSQGVNDTINYLRLVIDDRMKIYIEKNNKYSRAIYRQLLYNNKNIKNEIKIPKKKPNMNNPFIFFEIKIDDYIIGKIEIELFKDIVPITSENFRIMCSQIKEGLTYKNTKFNKLIKDFALYGGELDNYNDKNKCIYGEYFDDENYTYCHCRRGLLTMNNDGKNLNNSKFIITLKYIPWFDGKHVVFGQIIKGMDILEQIEKIETDIDDKPLKKIVIINCGEILEKNMDDYKDIKEDEIEINENIENNDNNIIEEKKNEIENTHKEITNEINEQNKENLTEDNINIENKNESEIKKIENEKNESPSKENQ